MKRTKVGMFDDPHSFAIITVTDHRDRTLFKLIKEIAGSPKWSVCSYVGPRDHKQPLRNGAVQTKSPLQPNLLKELPDGRIRLDVHGAPLELKEVVAVAERLAGAGETHVKITIDELRSAAKLL
jgi:hypothetical protein